MKRYIGTQMSDADKLSLLRKFGTVIEMVDATARITTIINGEDRMIELSTTLWRELKEEAE